MKPEAQRIAIAEACGWTFIESLAFTGIPKGSRGNADARVIPNYLSDLNAMHEAEKKLGDSIKLWLDYYRALDAVCERTGGNSTTCATAAQRAEAFLRTLNLWAE